MEYWNLKHYGDFRTFADPTLFSEERKPGIFHILLKTWRLLDPLLYTTIEMSHAIYRGVPDCAFKLKPSIFRRDAFKKMSRIEERNDYIRRCYGHFLETIRGRRGLLSRPLDESEAYELWSLGRHFGVKNTMLDWSHSPYVGLFFAFSDWRDDRVRSLFDRYSASSAT